MPNPALDQVRDALDTADDTVKKVRPTVDEILSVVSLIPLIGAPAAAIVKVVQTGLDTIATALSAARTALDQADPKS